MFYLYFIRRERFEVTKSLVSLELFRSQCTHCRGEYLSASEIHSLVTNTYFHSYFGRVLMYFFFGTYRSRDVRFVSLVVDIARVDQDFVQMYKITYL